MVNVRGGNVTRVDFSSALRRAIERESFTNSIVDYFEEAGFPNGELEAQSALRILDTQERGIERPENTEKTGTVQPEETAEVPNPQEIDDDWENPEVPGLDGSDEPDDDSFFHSLEEEPARGIDRDPEDFDAHDFWAKYLHD